VYFDYRKVYGIELGLLCKVGNHLLTEEVTAQQEFVVVF
jgi:hypothetical protein